MEASPAEKLLKKIHALEKSQERLKDEMSKIREGRKHDPVNARAGTGCGKQSVVNIGFYLNILQSMGQSVHMLDFRGRVIYWNHSAEKLYGYSAEEALWQDLVLLICDDRYFPVARDIIHRNGIGERWTGEFPVRNKNGENFSVVATNSPFYDDDGKPVGVISISVESRPFREIRVASSNEMFRRGDTSVSKSDKRAVSKLDPESGSTEASKTVFGSQKPIQVVLASKISNLATKISNKVKSRMRIYINSTTRDGVIRDSHPPECCLSEDKSDAKPSRFSCDEGGVRAAICKIVTSKAEEWKDLSWSLRGIEQDGSEATDVRSKCFQAKLEIRLNDSDRAASSGSSMSWSCTSQGSSSGSIQNGIPDRAIMDNHCLDNDILWEELTIGEQIGQGSCATVYHGLWFGSDVAVKVFSGLEYSDETIQSFKQEVYLMKRPRHPNVLLFMGAVTSFQRLCIVSELLPRGSLFSLLRRNTSELLDWRRRINMALDIARGMNYLHHCTPPIVHRDLKSLNLLVDRDWTVKVADFGLSRLKHETFLRTKSGRGTPQWMAPEVLRSEPSDEKSDVYSFGVILWELATGRIPWDNLNSMQVIAAVGFMNQRLEIPRNADKLLAYLIEICWHSNPKCRPSFKELLEKLKEVQRRSLDSENSLGSKLHHW